MKTTRLILAQLALLASSSLVAQSVALSPSPQSAKWSDNSFQRPTSLSIIGKEAADPDALSTLLSSFAEDKGGMRLTIGERGDKAVEAVAQLIPTQPEGYYLKITPDEVVIAGNDPNGTYYGVQTFLTLASGERLQGVEIVDWPATPNRGVVEGFYGNAWSHEDRLSQFDFYGRNKLNTYIYGPKDDPYHREKWREAYPPEEAARLKALNEEAARHKVNFVWGIHPAGDHSWTEADNKAIIRKFEQMYDLGFRNFAIFFDDVFGKQADGKKHAECMEYVRTNFVETHANVAPLLMCPSLYNTAWKGSFQPSYLEDISVMDPSIQVMWTGSSVVDLIDVADMEWINPRIGRKAYIWLNYPVSDYCVNHLLMGPLYGNEAAATTMVSGFTANPMEYAEASKVSLYSVADFLWNPDAYDSDNSWERALQWVMPDNTDAFRTFCLYNVDLGHNTHRLRRFNESPDMKKLIETYEESMTDGYSTQGVAAFRNEFEKMVKAGGELLTLSDSDPLVAEIYPWIKAFELQGRRGLYALSMYDALNQADEEKFIEAYKGYSALTDSASALTSRDFPGSIKVAYPMVGTLYAEPLLRRSVGKMEEIYRNNFNYALDLFPVLPLESGSYRILFNGKYLTNANAGSTGGIPVWQATEDDVNPDRQIWRITYEPQTGRYSIFNAKDGRYLNEAASFAVNPYDPDWNTFIITPVGEEFTITTAGAPGTAYWTVDNDGKLTRSHKADEQSAFQLIPVK